MTEATWTNQEAVLTESRPNRMKFVVAGVLVLAAIVFLVFNAMQNNTQLYVTVGEFYAQQSKFAGRDLRVSGWVMGDSIQFTQIDATTSRLEFDIVDDIANPAQRLHVVAMNEPMPDLLQHEAQALVEGHAENGAFMANQGGLFLKCPTRYEELEPGTTG
ncbi:MAG: cytochrome c maturation protein CcmE [Chloroflexi bacterium]|nr:cytochrome c maturation protein CcmE [Chloroflexota bacterium]MCI0578362.1 cytochrome c maturation protein CcmE [Chloroflexota bacterium]MCI0646235.1 cytochrome c maturation protein CcmE [Chloroflexota bacterium]MCI0732145.1 cytochrome c maturation protein CcmE [Chloroflexota bacterium]